MQVITIKPVTGKGWSLEVEGVQNPQIFRSGAAAERAARGLARRLAEAGQDAEVTIYLRNGDVGGRIVAAAE